MDIARQSSIMDGVVPRDRVRTHATDDDFRGLFEAAYPGMVRTVWFVVHDRAVAEEVAQDAFVELYRHWRKVSSYDQPLLWVRRVAIRKAQREAARRARRFALERKAATGARVEDELHLQDQQLLDAIRSLPPRQRAVLVLFYLEDLPMQEVAELVGCSPSTGFVHLHAARRRLADLLTEGVESDVR